ncbi:MAG: VOC family protein [Candidatus Devosia phytovorans]|uniref:VOC family protein n=1 Tax=Candidatus Devosia phytovorans TaxID=3121372 RepID=A0AAJ5VUX5_9HYPH|nr:VOC family protein [Devosia sp.]WEK04037.1 MAG: VOC family protein [Devosia sp.]
MRTESLYPLIQVEDVESTARFYETHLGMARIFSSDWYVQLRATADHPFEIALIRYDHDSIPTQGQVLTKGMVLSFYVADVDAEHARFQVDGVPVVQALRSEVFGQRHFIAADPNGLLLDIITSIEG